MIARNARTLVSSARARMRSKHAAEMTWFQNELAQLRADHDAAKADLAYFKMWFTSEMTALKRELDFAHRELQRLRAIAVAADVVRDVDELLN